MTVKKLLGKLHLWLGLSSGLVVFLVAITGCIYCFQEDIREWTEEYRFVEPSNRAFLPPSVLRKTAVERLPGKHLHSLQYSGQDRAVVATFFGPDHYYLMHLDPYTGKVLHVQNMDADFFRFILDGHFYLWLPEWLGQPVVAVATLVFLVMLITGLVLWWPKKNNHKQRFKIKWNARWRRKNYDLHAVLGFYVCVLGLVFAVTGLVWGFQWFAGSAYWVASGGESMKEYKEVLSVSKPGDKATYTNPVDVLWAQMSVENPGKLMDVHFPENRKQSIEIALNPDRGTYWKADYRYFDQNTLKEIETDNTYGKLKNANGGDLFMRMNYDIHVGQVWGFPGKLLAFFASLIVASLPVTGFLVWWGRKKKDKKPGRKAQAQKSEVKRSTVKQQEEVLAEA